MKSSNATPGGVALVLTLAFIVIITIIVVALSSLMRVERPTANSHFEKSRATLFAQQGIDSAVATLDQYVGNANRYWVTQPGQLIASDPIVTSTVSTSGTAPVLQYTIPLYSGSSSGTQTGVLQAPDLNTIALSDTTHLISNDIDPSTNAIFKMPVAWIYIRQNGTRDPSQQPAVSATNPIIGRFAYWTDDESGKINSNLAWGRASDGFANTSPQGDPTNLELTALTDNVATLTGSMASAIHAFVTTNAYQTVNAFFNTPEESRQVSVAGAVLNHFKFDVTHYNHDPDTTFFNQPRIVLTTRPDRAGWTYNTALGEWVGTNGLSGDPGTALAGTPPYLRILANEGTVSYPTATVPAQSGTATPGGLATDPGILNNLSLSRVNNTINFLLTYLQRTDWPMLNPAASGTFSFQDKYYTTGGAGISYPATGRAARLVQLAIDIIDYVRSKESPDQIVIPFRGIIASSTNSSVQFTGLGNPGTAADYSFLGSTRGPFITEVGNWCKPNSGHYDEYCTFEVYNPANYNMGTISPSQLTIEIEPTSFRPLIENNVPLSGSSMPQGSYETFTFEINDEVSTPPTIEHWRLCLGGPGGYTDLVPPTESNTNDFLNIPVTITSTSANATSIECDDPRVNYSTGPYYPNGPTGPMATGSFGAWIVNPVNINTFGRQNNAWTAGKPPNPNDTPQQDTDASGNLSAASLYMPPPAGAAGNVTGCMTSVGELGFVSTGIESNEQTAATVPLPPGTPWRTLRFQPDNSGGKTVPDWALMDLFTVPAISQPAGRAVYLPHTTDSAIGGRVNVNAAPAPFSMARTLPLASVLQAAPSILSGTASTAPLTPATAQQIAANIYNHVVATSTNGTLSSGTMYNCPNAFISQGEVCQIKGVADGGEQSEELVRQISNLITARSGVFSVYSVGQAIKQASGGKLTITGEQRIQSMVERVATANPSGNGTVVNFRTVYYRTLTP